MMVFKAIIRHITTVMNGRTIRGIQTLEHMRISRLGMPLFFYVLNRHTQGAFPYSFYLGKKPKDITYEMLEKHYDRAVPR